jgi:hypothetical protein
MEDRGEEVRGEEGEMPIVDFGFLIENAFRWTVLGAPVGRDRLSERSVRMIGE